MSTDGDLQVLRELMSRDVVTAQYIRDEVGHDATEFTQCLAHLKALGCEIDTTGAGEYRLVRTNLAIWEDYLNYASRNISLSVESFQVYRETASTQDLAKAHAPEQVVVLADQQTAGRGRLGREWHSEPETCVLMSVGKRITGQPHTHDLISMLTGVAVARAVSKLSPQALIRLKWPNDIMANDRKIAGVLIEAVDKMYIIGIGLNVHAPTQYDSTIRETAISLSEIGAKSDRLRVVEEVLAHLGNVLLQRDSQVLLNEWRSYSTLGQTQTFEQAGQRITGEVLDLDPDHGLIVRRDTGEIVTLPAATTSVVK
jgi:BirA family biotin operon repressor/biotin-[acetyl-CoA-carboxylase] ligase